jgi:hypothetical protein
LAAHREGGIQKELNEKFTIIRNKSDAGELTIIDVGHYSSFLVQIRGVVEKKHDDLHKVGGACQCRNTAGSPCLSFCLFADLLISIASATPSRGAW